MFCTLPRQRADGWSECIVDDRRSLLTFYVAFGVRVQIVRPKLR